MCHEAAREQAVVGVGSHFRSLVFLIMSSSAYHGHSMQVEEGVAHIIVVLEPVQVEHLLARAKDQAVDQAELKNNLERKISCFQVKNAKTGQRTNKNNACNLAY
jgi:hypothetical protein